MAALVGALLGLALPGLADYQDAYASYKEAVAAKDLDMALIYATKAHRQATEDLGLRNAKTGVLAFNLGAVSYELTRYRDALPPLQEAVITYAENYGPNSEKNVLPIRKLGETYRELNALPNAERQWARAIEILEIEHERTDPEITSILLDLLDLAQNLGQAKRMRSYAKRALYNLSHAGDPGSLQMGSVHISLSMAEVLLGSAAQANKNLDRAIEIYEIHLPPDDSRLLDLYAFAADAFDQTGRPSSARRCRRKLKEAEG